MTGPGDKPMQEDNEVSDCIALMVLDEFPIETIRKILQENLDRSFVRKIWLADTYDNIPDYVGTGWEGTSPEEIDSSWRSPFLGKTIQDAVDWMRGVPKPPKPINKIYCAVLTKDVYEGISNPNLKGEALICKWVENEEPQTITRPADELGDFVMLFEREDWDDVRRVQAGEPSPSSSRSSSPSS